MLSNTATILLSVPNRHSFSTRAWPVPPQRTTSRILDEVPRAGVANPGHRTSPQRAIVGLGGNLTVGCNHRACSIDTGGSGTCDHIPSGAHSSENSLTHNDLLFKHHCES